MTLSLAEALATLEALEKERAALQDEVASLDGLANAGELAGPLAHEFNNFLNILLLQVAVLEQTLPAGPRAELAMVRRQGKRAAALVGQWQQYRRRQQPAPRPLDLNQVLRAVAATLGDDSFRLRLTPDLPAVLASPPELKRLCMFLLANAAAVSDGDPPVQVCTESDDGRVLLRVEDEGPRMTPDAVQELFEPSGTGREGANRLELAACKSLVRRLEGGISAESRPEGGVAVVVELPAVAV